MKGYKECTTLCYIEKDGQYLMMHRERKINDENSGKYIGVGGHVEHGETPEECVVREVLEETGLKLNSYKLRGLITFSFEDKDELAFLYTSEDYEGEPKTECSEGSLTWVKKEKVTELPIWEGDKIFLDLLNKRQDYFSLKLVYKKDVLEDYIVY